MTYADALAQLGRARRFGMKLGLGPMQAFARELGSPQDRLRFIHIAGTNGKGSTAAFCESILRAAGFRVGLYTSPHLVTVRERVQIDRVPISERDFALGMDAVLGAASKSREQEPTFFEILTALALWYFAREKVEWVVWETGLGGRLDATNIVTPQVCIITNIGLEHQQYLGDTIERIAGEKAGIIKPGVPVVICMKPSRARSVIEAVAIARKSPIHAALPSTRDLGLIGWHQAMNAGCAEAAARLVDVAPEAVIRGVKETMWPGRFEVISDRPLIVLDGAHNPDGLYALARTWRDFLHSRGQADARAHIVFACSADKDIPALAAILRPIAARVSLVRLGHERGADPIDVEASFTGLPQARYESVADAWQDLQRADPSSLTLVTGSLFLVGEMLALREGAGEEYRLNERLEKAR